MRKGLKSDPDYAYGRLMLTLRTAIGLTQKRLADELCVSRRAVGEWEAGNSYPKWEHLKALIVLAVKCQAFKVGQEAEEIRVLWKMARQKVLLDEDWLSTLLSAQGCLPPPHHVMSTHEATVVAPAEITTEGSLQVQIQLTVLIAKEG